MGLMERAGAMNFIGGGLHKIKIESQDNIKKQKRCCHAGKQSSEKRNRLRKWSCRGGEEEFAC